jgi:hypothetical protein
MADRIDSNHRIPALEDKEGGIPPIGRTFRSVVFFSAVIMALNAVLGAIVMFVIANAWK